MMKEMLAKASKDKSLILPFVAARLKRLKKEGLDDIENEVGSS